ADHYRTRPVAELDPIFERLFTKILSPWYGQARAQPVALFDDNSPLHLFTTLLDDSEKLTGFGPGPQTIPCEPLGVELPNPWRMLNTLYRERVAWTRPWFSSITHGDLNMKNILLDEKENLYVIDFSETRPRNVCSDFARLETIVKFEMIKPEDEEELARLLRFEEALLRVDQTSDMPPLVYDGTNPMVAKAHHTLCLLRRLACGFTSGRADLLPYLVALLEWTFPVPFFVQLSTLQKRFGFYSAALIARRMMELL
ncbi:MAG: phosphotransferase, partial [Lentisphaerota bacterium]